MRKTTMKRFTLSILFLLALALPAFPFATVGKISASGSDCSTATRCVIQQVPQVGGSSTATVTIQVSGTYTGTIQFEASPDGQTWYGISGSPVPSGASASSTTGTGVWRFQVAGFTHVRARASALASGYPVVFIQSSFAISGITGGSVGVNGGSGTANTIPKFNSSTVIADSLLTDDGTTLTYSGLGGVAATLATAAQPNVTSLGTQAADLNMGTKNITNAGTVTTGVLIATTSSTPLDNQACTAGTFYWDSGNLYLCVASGTVKKVALSSY